MKRRRFIAFMGGALAAPLARAQAARMARVGYLVLTPVLDPPSPERRALLDGLRAQGYESGRNLTMVYRSAENEPDFMDDMAREMVAQKVDVILTAGAAATLSAKKATGTVPIVMMAIGDPVGVGAVDSLARPGRNITGVSFISSDLAPKRVQLVREIAPHCKRLAILWDIRNENARVETTATIAAARSLGMVPESLGVESDRRLVHMLEEASRRKADALYVAFEGGLVATHRSVIAEYGLRRKLPVISGWSGVTDAGGLLSYAPDIPAMFHRAAFYVHRILNGEKPANLPVELPTRIELVVNLRTAKAIGAKVSRELRLRADRLIE
jgi:putative ABC transport system substrate-binding protein